MLQMFKNVTCWEGNLEKTEDSMAGQRPAGGGQDNLKRARLGIRGRWGFGGCNERRWILTI